MPIDAATALSAEPRTQNIAWTQRDVLLYHLSLGAGRHADTDPELRWTFERDLQVLPTFALVAGQGPSVGDLSPAAMRLPGIDIDLRRILHGGQALTVHRQIPPAGSATVSTRVAEIWDKGKAAVIVLRSDATDPDGNPLWTTAMQIWARGEGGFGGDAGSQPRSVPPESDPDHRLMTPTTS